MVQVNKLRKTIGRLHVKVALNVYAHGGDGVAVEGGRARRGGRDKYRPKVIDLAGEYEPWVYQLLCDFGQVAYPSRSLRASGVVIFWDKKPFLFSLSSLVPQSVDIIG